MGPWPGVHPELVRHRLIGDIMFDVLWHEPGENAGARHSRQRSTAITQQKSERAVWLYLSQPLWLDLSRCSEEHTRVGTLCASGSCRSADAALRHRSAECVADNPSFWNVVPSRNS